MGREFSSIFFAEGGFLTLPTGDVYTAHLDVYDDWDGGLHVDSDASMRMEVVGASPNRSVIFEWRNILRTPGLNNEGVTQGRLSFEVILDEDGTITYNYADMDTDFERGDMVQVDTSDGESYSWLRGEYRTVLENGRAITWRPPASH